MYEVVNHSLGGPSVTWPDPTRDYSRPCLPHHSQLLAFSFLRPGQVMGRSLQYVPQSQVQTTHHSQVYWEEMESLCILLCIIGSNGKSVCSETKISVVNGQTAQKSCWPSHVGQRFTVCTGGKRMSGHFRQNVGDTNHIAEFLIIAFTHIGYMINTFQTRKRTDLWATSPWQ